MNNLEEIREMAKTLKLFSFLNIMRLKLEVLMNIKIFKMSR